MPVPRAALPAVLLLAAATTACSSPDPDAAPPPTTTATQTSSASPTPEDRYVLLLTDSGLFPNIGEVPDFWLTKGRLACELLDRNHGDIVATRFDVQDELVVMPPQGPGYADPELTDRAITIVDAASLHLCP